MTDDCDIDGDYRRTIDKLKQELAKVREATIEECARVCDRGSKRIDDMGALFGTEIRALKEQP